MKILNRSMPLFMMLLGLFSSATVLAREAVNGYYDAKNDWFVFEWTNPDSGNKKAILDTANKVKPLIHANVSLDQSAKRPTYTYSYRVTNLQGAVQSLDDIAVKHFAPVFGATSPSPQDLWMSSEYEGTNSWAWEKIRKSAKGVLPGEKVQGLSFKSNGIPTIVDSWFTGTRRAEFVPPSPDWDTEEVQSSFDRVFRRLESQYPTKFVESVTMKTVGPTEPPANFDAASFIKNLISLAGQSEGLGWIRNEGLAKSLRTKLNHAAKELAACKFTVATNVVNAFVNEVREAGEKDKHPTHGKELKDRDRLTSEGYAVLFFNGEYLLTQLKNSNSANCRPASVAQEGDDSKKTTPPKNNKGPGGFEPPSPL